MEGERLDEQEPRIDAQDEVDAPSAASSTEEEDFERMLRELSEELASMDDDEIPTDDGEADADTGGLDPDLEATILDTPPPSEPTPHLFGPNDLLTISYAVQVSTGSGGFVETEARGVLANARGYPITALDDFAFGFDGMRNAYEIILDPNALGYGLSELPTGTQWNIRVDENGRLVLDKPVGLRVAVHRIDRDASGGQALTPLCNEGPDAPQTVHLAIEVDDPPAEHAEFMVGMGLADTEPPSFAFSVYLAVKLKVRS